MSNAYNSHNPQFHFISVPTTDLTIPLRYYRGWNIEFTTKNERFNSPLLSLYGFQSAADLERAIDYALERRGQKNP